MKEYFGLSSIQIRPALLYIPLMKILIFYQEKIAMMEIYLNPFGKVFLGMNIPVFQ